LCPKPAGTFVKEDFVRFWNDTANWPNNVLPADGDNVSINGNWTMIMNIQPNNLNYLEIDGDLIIPEQAINITLQANYIWIRYGKLQIGEETAKIDDSRVTIQLNGNKDDNTLTIDSMFSGNKLLAVTGTLQTYVNTPAAEWTKLKSFATAGSTTIDVLTASGWAVGDEIVIAPSFTAQTEFERVTITAISGTTVTFTPALQYNHFGAAEATIEKSYGVLDTRAGVGHMTRKVKITAGPDAAWGYTVFAYTYVFRDELTPDPTTGESFTLVTQTGNLQLNGVEFQNGGQYDTEQSALHIKDMISDDASVIT